jgi:dynactin 1
MMRRRRYSLTCSEIDDLRDQHAEVQQETATTSKEAQALMNLNMKLQSTASKAQNKTIELELKRLEAAQLAQHLRVVSVSRAPVSHILEAIR